MFSIILSIILIFTPFAAYSPESTETATPDLVNEISAEESPRVQSEGDSQQFNLSRALPRAPQKKEDSRSIGILTTAKSALVFDDWNNIIHNQDIKSLSSLPIVWHNRPSRFIANLSFAINFAVGKYNVFGYHLVNIAIHLLNAIVLFFLIRQIQKTKVIKNNSVLNSNWLPLVSSLLFVSHPIFLYYKCWH